VVREDLQGGTRRDLLSVFLLKKYIHSCSFYLSGSVNKFLKFCVVYFPCCFLKMAIKISHSHFVHVAFVSILVFQTFDRMIFGTLTFPGTRWYVMTVWDTQMVRDKKKFENHCFRGISRLGSAFFFLRCFKLAHICIQLTSLYRCNKQGINHRFLSLAYFTWGVKLRESWT